MFEEEAFSRAYHSTAPKGPPPYEAQTFVPVVVTTANLFLCGFRPEDVNPNTGEIAIDKASIKPVSYIWFDYPLPRRLQAGPISQEMSIRDGAQEALTRMPILVVHSSSLREILKLLSDFPHGVSSDLPGT